MQIVTPSLGSSPAAWLDSLVGQSIIGGTLVATLALLLYARARRGQRWNLGVWMAVPSGSGELAEMNGSADASHPNLTLNPAAEGNVPGSSDEEIERLMNRQV
jgi:hypothetical protein